MNNYGREIPNFSGEGYSLDVLADPYRPSDSEIHSYQLAAEILECQGLYQEFGRPMADEHWDKSVVPKFAQLGYENSVFSALTEQSKTTIREWRKAFDEFNRRFRTLGEDSEADYMATYQPTRQDRRLSHFMQINSLIHLLEEHENGEIPEDQKDLVEEVIDCSRRLLLQSNTEITDLPKDISEDGRDLLVTNQEVINWLKNYIQDLD